MKATREQARKHRAALAFADRAQAELTVIFPKEPTLQLSAACILLQSLGANAGLNNFAVVVGLAKSLGIEIVEITDEQKSQH